MVNNCCEIICAKKWRFIITFIVLSAEIFFFCYKAEDWAIKIISLCVALIVAAYQMIKAFEIKCELCCCWCKKKKQNNEENDADKKKQMIDKANELIKSMDDEIALLEAPAIDGELNFLLKTLKKKKKEKEILYEEGNKQNNEKKKEEKEKLYIKGNKQNKEEKIKYDEAKKKNIIDKANELIKSWDDEIALLIALDVEDVELNPLLLKIKNKKEEIEKLYEEGNKQNNEEKIKYDTAMKKKIKNKANELIKSLDDEIELLESLLIEDADLNSLLSNIKNKKEEKEKLYIKN